MSHYVLDTNHVGVLLRQSTMGLSVFKQRLVSTQDILAVSMPTVAELWFMVSNSKRVEENSRRLELLLAALPCFEFDAAAAREYGTIATELRRIGKPIPQIDIQIAAIAKTNGLIVATSDSHFSHVSGITVVNLLAQ